MSAVLEVSSMPHRSVFLDAPSPAAAGLPEWFVESRRSAWEAFTALPMPTRRDEAWRFANLSHLNFDRFHLVEDGGAGRTTLLEKTAARLVFVNDRLVSKEINDTALEVLPLVEALKRHGDKLRDLLTTPDTGLGSAKFAALHQAQLREAVVVIVPENVEIAEPVEIVHWLSGADAAAFPRTLIVTGANAKVTVLEHHLSNGEDAGFSCGAAQLFAGEGSTLDYTLLNRRNTASKTLHLSTVRAVKDSRVRHAIFNLGGGWVRTECRSVVTGEGARSDMLGVSLASGEQEIDQRTLQDHASARTYSDLLYKNVLFDASRTVFAGLIKVDEGAHYTDAYQKCRNLLLSEECEANSMPGLEINADQVKCSHGSTSGRIEEEEVFYFQSRGIPRDTAEQLIALGFAAEVIERAGHEAVAELTRKAVEERFAELRRQA